MSLKKTRSFILTAASLSLIVAAGVVLLFVPFEKQISPQEKQWLITAKDLSPHWVALAEALPAAEISYEESLLGEKSLDYQWEMDYAYINIIAEKSLGSNSNFPVFLIGLHAGIKAEGGTLVDEGERFRWGDNSRLYSLTEGDLWLGYIFLGQWGSKIILISITGPFVVKKEVVFADLERHLKLFGDHF